MKERQYLPFAAVGEVSRVKQAEGKGRQGPSLLASSGNGLDERRRVPFGVVDPVALQLEPTM